MEGCQHLHNEPVDSKQFNEPAAVPWWDGPSTGCTGPSTALLGPSAAGIACIDASGRAMHFPEYPASHTGCCVLQTTLGSAVLLASTHQSPGRATYNPVSSTFSDWCMQHQQSKLLHVAAQYHQEEPSLTCGRCTALQHFAVERLCCGPTCS